VPFVRGSKPKYARFLPIVAIAVGVVVGSALAFGSQAESRNQQVETLGLRALGGGSDAVLTVEATEVVGTTDIHDFATVETWTVEVIAVDFFAEHLASQWQTPEKDLSVPNVQTSQRLEVAWVTPVPLRNIHNYDLDKPGVYTIGLTYNDPDRINGLRSPWTLNFVAEVNKNGVLLQGPDHLVGVWQDHLETLASLAGTQTGPDLLAAWAAEHDAIRGGGEPGPLLRSQIDYVDPDRHAWFYRLPSDERPLDPSLTPPEVLATLVETTLILDPGDSNPDDFIHIRSSTGVVYVASVGADVHPATVLSKPGDAWEVLISPTPKVGRDSTLVGHVESSAWQLATLPSTF